MNNTRTIYTDRHKKRQKSVLRMKILLALLITALLAGTVILSLPSYKNPLAAETEPYQELSTETTPAIQTNTASDDWNLILVNRWNPIPEDYDVTLTELQNGHSVDSRIYPDLQRMFDDARAQGILPTITSSFRTAEYQQQLLDEKIAEYEASGYARKEAEELAKTWVAVPGTSEHEIGIAVDISSADAGQQDPSVVWQWLNENSYKYGFILRYPEDKTDVTGVIYEPWHYRYVGQETAREIYEQGVCLEEFL